MRYTKIDGRWIYPASTVPTDIIQAVRDGMCSMRRAAQLLGCDTDAVQLAAWGELRL